VAHREVPHEFRNTNQPSPKAAGSGVNRTMQTAWPPITREVGNGSRTRPVSRAIAQFQLSPLLKFGSAKTGSVTATGLRFVRSNSTITDVQSPGFVADSYLLAAIFRVEASVRAGVEGFAVSS
jgi:hypothetical protein